MFELNERGRAVLKTYTTLDGKVLDLSGLNEEEQGYFERCYRAYRDGGDWHTLGRLVTGSENPLLQPTGGYITRAVAQTALYQAVRDLKDRAGINSDDLEPEPGDRPELDPLDDTWLPAPAAAKEKGVSVVGLHKAIKRGDLVAAPAKPGGSWLVVSRNSLTHWSPNRRRQAGGRKRPAAVTGVPSG